MNRTLATSAHDHGSPARGVRLRIGLDFDNTLICYDELFHSIASERGLISPAVTPNKREIRDAVRSLPDGEVRWQTLQAEVYGPRIRDARPYPGLIDFLQAGTARQVTFFIVSHKSRYAAQDKEQGHDLVRAAKDWLAAHEIVSTAGPVFPQNVYFEPSRQEKISRIGRLQCDAFIDDLEETFSDAAFPASTRALLLDTGGLGRPRGAVDVCRSWTELSARVFTRGE
jgi:hypothetical protein